MNTLAQTSVTVNNLTLADLPTRFAIERRGDSYTVVYLSGSVSTIDRTRFRHHGRRKYRNEHRIINQYTRISVSKENAFQLVNGIGATPLHSSDYGDKHVYVEMQQTTPTADDINAMFETARLADDVTAVADCPQWHTDTTDYDMGYALDVEQTQHDASYRGQW